MKKSLLLVVILLLFSGCEEIQQGNEHFTVNKNQVTVVDANLTFTFRDDFTISGNSIEFGPEATIPESPTTGNNKTKAFKLEIIPKRNVEGIPSETDPIPTTINNHEVIKWSLEAFCHQNRYELIGEKNNVLIRATTCEDHDSDKIFTALVDSINL